MGHHQLESRLESWRGVERLRPTSAAEMPDERSSSLRSGNGAVDRETPGGGTASARVYIPEFRTWRRYCLESHSATASRIMRLTSASGTSSRLKLCSPMN